MNPLFVTMYTPLYEKEVAALLESITDLGGDVELLPVKIDCRGSWIANVQQKADVVLGAMDDWPNRDIVWVDSDARFKAEPTLLYEMETRMNFAAYFIPDVFKAPMRRPWGPQRSSSALAGGTMYFANRQATRNLVIDWIAACQLRPTTWEQQNLQRVLGETIDSDVFYFSHLPQAYCKVFDRDWYPREEGPVVILHTQASRKLKRKVK